MVAEKEYQKEMEKSMRLPAVKKKEPAAVVWPQDKDGYYYNPADEQYWAESDLINEVGEAPPVGLHVTKMQNDYNAMPAVPQWEDIVDDFGLQLGDDQFIGELDIAAFQQDEELGGMRPPSMPGFEEAHEQEAPYIPDREARNRMDDMTRISGADEVSAGEIVVPTCPNRDNKYHTCSEYCQNKYGNKANQNVLMARSKPVVGNVEDVERGGGSPDSTEQKDERGGFSNRLAMEMEFLPALTIGGVELPELKLGVQTTPPAKSKPKPVQEASAYKRLQAELGLGKPLLVKKVVKHPQNNFTAKTSPVKNVTFPILSKNPNIICADSRTLLHEMIWFPSSPVKACNRWAKPSTWGM